jgi:hypothetical protein
MIANEQRGILSFELNRLKAVMIGIAKAVYFNTYGLCGHDDWHVMAQLHTRHSLLGGTDDWTIKQFILGSLTYRDLKQPIPEVFKCEQAQLTNNQIAFRFTFYEGFIVYAWCGSPDPRWLISADAKQRVLWHP